MKILQIRGRNLASLAGDFELDFEQGPLAEAGLFAIAGPTGAGKSTLLDALSLALYDRTPRLDEKSPYQIPDGPDNHLGVSDTRHLLRRGAGSGHAEVRFVGTDGRRYCARWSVRRAREAAGGKLQAVDMQLLDEEAKQLIGRNKTEVLPAIERIVGLTFDQFRRSVLLAQGDFAAFLRAKGDERSDLLERMTGTDIYSRISQRAHLKARGIEQDLLRQEQAAQALPILDAEARAALQARVAELEQAVAATAQRLTTLREHRAWWVKSGELSHRLAQARESLAAAQQRWDEAAPRRQSLAEIDAVQPLRTVAADAARTATEAEAADQRLAAAAAALQLTQADEARAKSAHTQATQALEAQRAHQTTTRPQIDNARALDLALGDKGRSLEAATRRLSEAGAALATLQQQAQDLDARRAQVGEQQAALAAWAQAHGPELALAQGWDGGVAPQLQAFQKAHARWTAQRAALPVLQRAHEQAAAGQASARQALTTAETAAQAAQQAVQQAEAAEAAHPAAGLAERRTALQARRDNLALLRQQRDAAARARQDIQERQAESAKARKECEDAHAQAGQAAAARQEVEQQAALTERLLLQLGLAAHRAQLVEGEPCPLCGATHHPGTGPVDTTVAALEAQHRQQTARRAELQQREEREKARAEGRAARVLELGRDMARRQLEQDTAATQWAALGGEGDPLAEASATWLQAADAAVHAEAHAIAQWDQMLEQLRRAAADARQKHGAAAASTEQARTALVKAEMAAAAALGQWQTATTDVATHRQLMDGTVENLAPAFGAVPGWQAELEAGPPAFTAQWNARVAEARQKAQALEACRLQLADIDQQRALKAQALQQAQQQREAVDAECSRVAAERQTLLAQRQQVLQGRPVAEVESALQAALHACEQAHTTATAQLQRTAEDAARKGEAHRLATQAATTAVQARQAAAQALAQALQAAGLDAQTLQARLAHAEDWLQAERAALARIERQRADEAAAFEQRQRDLAAHQAQPAPAEPLAEIDAQLAALDPQHHLQTQQLGAERLRLAQDDQHRADGAARAQALAQARQQAAVWLELDALIGSADGKRLRKFAQSMTLEFLLAHANAELASLAPRYLLQRVKAQDMELQVVDRDMGDEIRSTSSLSGGETFLVSLALALGLSSLASEKVRIESLFIDEGFGTLDPKTLETALATLDALQSAGRKVGLISHVPGLAERIGVQVLVQRQGQGASTVRVVAA